MEKKGKWKVKERKEAEKVEKVARLRGLGSVIVHYLGLLGDFRAEIECVAHFYLKPMQSAVHTHSHTATGESERVKRIQKGYEKGAEGGRK